jgi:branched-chain amino acid aminotransferase
VSVVWLDGQFVPRTEARVSIDDLGFLYGAACFETMRAFSGTVFRLDRHLDRMAAGLGALGLAQPPRARLTEAIAATLAANGLRDARIRLTVSAGRGKGRPDLAATEGPTVLVVAEPATEAPAPAKLLVASHRVDEQRALATAKTANYLLSLLTLAEARAAGCDEALLLNHRGHVAEAATANVFLVARDILVTPPLSDGPLPGVTREAVLECAHHLGLPAEERSLDLDALRQADEVFLTNSVVGLRPVAAVSECWDGRGVPGRITEALSKRYGALVREECGLEA